MKKSSSSDIFRSLRTDDCARFLSLANQQFDLVGDLGRSLLHEAIAHGRVDAAHALIEGGARVDVRDDLGRTPLHYAAMFGQTDTATRLIDAGADPNAIDQHGNNPLWTAILNPRIDHELVRLLVRMGASRTTMNKAGKSVATMAEIIGNEDLSRALESCT